MSDLNNVDRLMRELNVEQLIQIQASLKNEMEKKREELRRLVGRRYRDVLEASNTVKRLCEIANELASMLADIQQAADGNKHKSFVETAFLMNDEQRPKNLSHKFNANRCFLLIQNLFSLCFVSDELLVRAFSFCLADFFHRTLTSESSSFSFSGPHLPMFSDQLIQIRLELLDTSIASMGADACSNVTVPVLVAYLLLRPRTTLEELLQLFLKSRMEFVMKSLQQPDSTLLGLIKDMKNTVQCAEQIFGHGGTLLATLQCVTAKGWSPTAVERLVDNQPLCTRQLLKAEIERVNGIYTPFQLPVPKEVQEQCSDWVLKMCGIVGERVRKMCSYFEHVEQAVEFAVAVGQLFKSNWSNIFDSNALIYRQLFGNSLSERFCELIAIELSQLEHKIRSKMGHINCEPSPLFHKRSAKFDAILAFGISRELNELIQQLNDELYLLYQNIVKYIQISQEEGAEQLHQTLADQVLAFVDRLTDFTSWNVSGEMNPQLTNAGRSRWLSLFRLLLALVQHEPSVLCQCMNRNLDKIVQCNRKLHKATEETLCLFMDFVIDECVRATNILFVMPECCSSWDRWTELLQEPESVHLRETATLDVPTQLSKHLFLFLTNIYREINQHSLGHLFTRSVTLHVSQRIGNLFSQLLCQCIDNCASMPQIYAQLLLDSKILFLMFSDKGLIDAAKRAETKMDPIEFSVLQEPISRNANLFVHRTAMLFGQLQAEPKTTLKDAHNQLLSSYTQLVDITPKGSNVQRLTPIPRLSKLTEENQSMGDSTGVKQSKKPRKTKTGVSEGGLGLPVRGVATSSFSSLYDKISTGWFKS